MAIPDTDPESIASLLDTALKKAEKSGLTPQECIAAVTETFKVDTSPPEKKTSWKKNFLYYAAAIVILYIANYAETIKYDYQDGLYTPDGILSTINSTFCIVEQSQSVLEISRPLANCSSMCDGLTEVPRLQHLSKERFLKEFAYTGKPLIVTDATKNWTAIGTFNYTYFKKLYDNIDGAYEKISDSCQFFPYKTKFKSLKHVMRMSKKRSKLLKDQWYIGWSNCDVEAMKQIREHYSKPYFLPDEAESSNIDWMFMGGSGEGADIHIDSVERPSWQAQITGKKTWILIPPPECEHVCRTMNATMETGDVVVVDTNSWYHSTFIHPGEMSITVGTEYD